MPNKNQRIDKDYYEWRKKVVERDENTCQFPKCGCRKNIEVHHIFRYADNLYLRTDVNNGISLCKTHHKLITGSEEYYAVIFLEIIKAKRNNKKDNNV
mgnify:CR=1 FL=1